MLIEKVLYCVYVKVIGGCDGCVMVFESGLDLKLIMLCEFGGVGGVGVNFE